MTPHYADDAVTLYAGDCLDVLRGLPDASVDAVVTDPPYGLEFMGREWDAFRPQRHPRTAGRAGAGNITGSAGISNDTSTPRGRSRASFGGQRQMTLECDTCGVRSPIDRKHSSKAPDCPGNWVSVEMYPDAPSPLLPFQLWCEQWATECLRVLKPGGHMLAFGGSRTWHRLTCAIEDAGFEVRDSIAWLYGSGFPKSLDVSKAIDRAAPRVGMFDAFAEHFRERRAVSGYSQKEVAKHFPSKTGGLTGCVWNWENGANVPTPDQWLILAPMLGLSDEWLPLIERVEAERERVGSGKSGAASVAFARDSATEYDVTAPATDDARRWQGWGTALKPAFEPIVVARKPLAGTVAATVLEYGTGALNIDASRVESPGGLTLGGSPRGGRSALHMNADQGIMEARERSEPHSAGRWPPNVVLDDAAADELDQQSGTSVSAASVRKRAGTSAGNGETLNRYAINEDNLGGFNDSGGASRFFPTFRYEPKAGSAERPRVASDTPQPAVDLGKSMRCAACGLRRVDGARPSGDGHVERKTCTCAEPEWVAETVDHVAHPTVKPLALMRWLVKLVTPPGGTVLEPFAGSGTTAEACVIEGFKCIAIERDETYLPLIVARLSKPIQVALDFDGEAS